MIELPPPFSIPEPPAIIMPAPALIHPEWYWLGIGVPGLVPGPGFRAGGKTDPPTVAWLSNTIRNSSGTGFTFTGVGFGAADPTREIAIVCLYNFGSSTTACDEMTIGGETGILIEDTGAASGSNSVGASMWTALLPEGTSGSVVTGFTASVDRHTIMVFRKINGTLVLHDSSQDKNLVADPSLTLNIPPNGAAIAAAVNERGTAGWAWTGLTERTDVSLGSDAMTAATDDGMSQETARAIAADYTGAANNDNALVAASWS